MTNEAEKPLVIGISSRALFDLEAENRIFEEQGLTAYREWQTAHEEDVLGKGPAFNLVQAFLNVNTRCETRMTEVVVMSRNSPETSQRIFHSIAHYGLDITRAALAGGAKVAPYVRAFGTDLFLSANADDVKAAVDDGIAAGVILTGRSHSDAEVPVEQIRIAFDGDAVLFSAESERIFRHRGVDAFIRHEQDRADIPLAEGPFAGFLKALSRFQNIRGAGGEPVVRTALVTSRNLPAQARAIRTLRAWGVRVDEAVFLGGMEKQDVLAAFGAHIFFDDQRKHADRAQEVVQAAVVPYREGDDPASPPEGE